MRKNRSLKIFRKLHKWPGIIIALYAILFAASGIVMNHRQTFSSIDVSRNLLPSNYRYQNWNLAAVRGSLPLKNDSLLIFGNIGIWKTTENLKQFSDFNQGFPGGIDGRKIYSVVQLNNTLAGIHLRPPLLIPIANKKVGIIPGTHLDNPNPWFDKLRRVEWNENLNRYIFSTSEGFYASGENFSQLLQPVIPQPPVSVMGLNVFKFVGEMRYNQESNSSLKCFQS